MDEQKSTKESQELEALCLSIRVLMEQHGYRQCENILRHALGTYPHDPQPHNLLGVLLEKEGQHLLALRHFRAACALDPTYLPARQNLECYGTFFSHGRCAYDENDCPQLENNSSTIEYDTHGIGRVVQRK